MPRSSSHSTDVPPPAASLPATSPLASDDAVWEQYAELLDELTRLAKQTDDRVDFYTPLLEGCVEGMAAEAGAVWVPESAATFTLLTATTDTATAPTELLAAACRAPVAITAKPTEGPATTLCAVRIGSPAKVSTVLQVTHPAGRADAVCHAVERLLDAVAEVATEFHFRELLRDQTQQIQWRGQLLTLADRVSGDPHIGPTTYRIANECRRLLECDRVSVVRLDGQRPCVEAISGVGKIDRRSGAARRLEQIAKLVAIHGSALSSDDAGLPDEILDRLDEYMDATHARSVYIAPIARQQANEKQQNESIGVLIAEQFDATTGRLDCDTVLQTATTCAPALYAATQMSASPFARFLQLGTVVRLLATVGSMAAIVAALVLIQVEHTVTLRGVAQPVVQRDLFAPADAVVDRVAVVHGQRVAIGDTLIQLSRADLTLQRQQLEGELLSAEQSRNAIAAARSSIDPRSTDPAAKLRLAAEERRHTLRVEALQKELQLLEEERASLQIVSPIAGIVVTWRPQEMLSARPVERGQRLLTVVDDRATWRVELDAPDDRVGLLLDAQQILGEPLRVAFEVAQEGSVRRTGLITRIAARAETTDDNTTVRIEVAPDEPLADGEAVVPGATIRAEVQCGQRSLGYIAFHDIWNQLTGWWRL